MDNMSLPNDSRAGGLNSLNIILTILPCIAILLRIWSRLTLKARRFWWDDWLVITTLVSIETSTKL